MSSKTSIDQELEAAQKKAADLKKASFTRREPIKGTLGGIIQKTRQAKGMSVGMLVHAAGISVGLVSKIERIDDHSPTLITITKIARALGLKAWELIKSYEDSMEVKA